MCSIPEQFYQPIEQQLVIVKTSKQVAIAQKLSDFILQTNSQATLQQLGYLPVKTEND